MRTKNKFKETEIGMIPEDWEVKPLESVSIEIIDGDRGVNYPNGKDFSGIGYCLFLNTKNVPDTKFDFTETMFITKEKDEQLRKGKLKRKDIVLTTRGTVGNVALYDNNIPFDHIRINSGMVIIRNLKKEFHTNFLFQILRSPIFRNQVLSSFTGSAQPQLPIRDLKKIYVLIPSIDEQSAIAKILSDLDFTIELNIQMNKTLEAIGQAIFKRCFVDFEFPNEEGKPYKSSGGEMVDSEMGEIPEGWQVSNLGDCGTFKNGINYLRSEIGDTDFFIANVRDIANNKLLLKEYLDKIKIDFKKAKDYLLNKKDILIARSASPGEISLVLGDLEKVIYSGFSIRYRPHNPNNYLYFFLIMQGLKNRLLDFSIGTTLQSVNQETLKNMKFILPSDKILGEFNKIAEQLLDKTFNNLIQNRELSQIRDLLLPRLMSGKIRVV